MGKQKSIPEYRKEIAELTQQALDTAAREKQLTMQEIPAKETEVAKAKAAVKAKKDEILASTRQLREQLKALEKQQRTVESELRQLSAEEKEARRLQNSIPRRIKMREERIEELKKQGYAAPAQAVNGSSREEVLLKPTGLQDLASVMEEVEIKKSDGRET